MLNSDAMLLRQQVGRTLTLLLAQVSLCPGRPNEAAGVWNALPLHPIPPPRLGWSGVHQLSEADHPVCEGRQDVKERTGSVNSSDGRDARSVTGHRALIYRTPPCPRWDLQLSSHATQQSRQTL